MTEFWSELLTKASWKKLQELKGELKRFVVIGGWAVYLWTGMHKSKDIDIIVDFAELEKLKQAYDLRKNPQLKKYEIKFDKFDIDIYVPYFSEFSIPIEDLLKKTAFVQSFETPEPEALLILKQSAEISRKGSIKGEKDAIDILSLLVKAPFKKQRYLQTLKKYNLMHYADELKGVIRNFDAKNSMHVGLSFKEFGAWKKKALEELRA